MVVWLLLEVATTHNEKLGVWRNYLGSAKPDVR